MPAAVQDFAKNKTKENISEQKYCATLSQAKLNETVEMNETCTPDGCVRISGGRKIARRAYCEIQLRQNQKIFEAWLKEAEAILARMEADQKSRSGRTLSEFTHATLIDSMLRDWALPVGDTQAAFEHWRVNRRAAAWETLTRELDRMGIDRRALAGENVVFLATINDDRLKIRPVMVVDLQRSVVVVDERVGATAVVDAWGERRDGQAADPMTEAPTLAAVSRATPTVQASLERDPAQTMSRLLSLWAAEISRTDPDRDQRLAKAKQMAEFENASAAANLVATLDTAGYDDWKKQVIPVINTVIESRHISPETLLRAALSIAKRVTSGDPSASSSETPAAWSFLADAADKPSAGMLALPRFREIEAHFGLSPSLLVYNFKQRARSLDASFIDTALRERAWPKEASAIEQRYRAIRTSPQTRIDLEVSATHMISSALKQRSLVLASYRTLLDDEATRARRWELVSDHLTRANEIETTSDVNGELDHVLAKIRAQQQNTVGQDTIVRHQLAAQLNRIATRLMSVADIYNRYSDRYSSDHELLSARVAFENGAYAEALRRYFSFELPVALWAPNLTWRVLEGDFRGVPNGLRSTVDADELVLSARRGADWVDIMRIRGAKMDALRQLGAALVEAVSAGKGSVWWDGEQVSDKILTLEIPVRPELAEAAKAIRGEGAGVATQRSTLWLQVLKAMVYTCTPPAVGLIDLSGRCRSESKATARHDRVSIGGGAVMVPDLEAVKRVAQTKFAVP
jgi:hypothetical protein